MSQASTGDPVAGFAYPLEQVVQRANVDAVEKGNPSQLIGVEGYAPARNETGGAVHSGKVPPTLLVGTRYILFLKRQGGDPNYVLTWQSSQPVAIAAAPLAPSVNGQGLLPIATMVIESVRSSQDDNKVYLCLGLLGDLGEFSTDNTLSKQWPSAEIDLPKLREYMLGTVLPEIVKRASSPNAWLRDKALYEWSLFHDPLAIARLRAEAEANPSSGPVMALALLSFASTAAAPQVTTCLSAGDEDLRNAVAQCLGCMDDQRALPFLIDALSDSSADVSYSAASALYAITNEMPACARSDFPTQQASYVRHWSLWASNHKRSLDQLRSLVQRQLNDADSNAAR
jgi:hypothetical protein